MNNQPEKCCELCEGNHRHFTGVARVDCLCHQRQTIYVDSRTPEERANEPKSILTTATTHPSIEETIGEETTRNREWFEKGRNQERQNLRQMVEKYIEIKAGGKIHIDSIIEDIYIIPTKALDDILNKIKE